MRLLSPYSRHQKVSVILHLEGTEEDKGVDANAYRDLKDEPDREHPQEGLKDAHAHDEDYGSTSERHDASLSLLHVT